MPTRPFKTGFKGQLSVKELQRLQKETARQGTVMGGGGTAARDTPAGILLTDERPRPIWVRLSSVSSGAYAWQEVIMSTPGVWANDAAGRSSTTSNTPAYEVNDRDAPTGALGTGAIVQIWPAHDRESYWFDYGNKPFAVENDLAWSISTTLTAAVTTTTQSTLDVTAAGKFPAFNKFVVLIDSEELLVGAPNTGTNAWSSVVRGWNGTTAATHSNGATVTLVQSSPVPDVAKLLASMVFETYGGEEGTLSGSVTGATNASPIVITSAGHGLATGDIVRILGVLGNTAANGLFQVTVTGSNTFSIPATGNGAYTSGGAWRQRNTDEDGATILNQLQMIEVLSGPDGDGFYQGYRLEYNPNAETVDTKEDIIAIDLNNF